jgi:hypothetical protein
MQVVAAITKLLGHALDPLLEGWAARPVSEEFAGLRSQLVDANAVFARATDALKDKERELIDYYALDLVDMAAYQVNSWLLLGDAQASPRRADLARAYIAASLPKLHAAAEAIFTADATPLQVRETVLSPEF